MTQVICSELTFKSVFGLAVRRDHDTGIIYQNMQVIMVTPVPVCKIFNALQVGKVKMHNSQNCIRIIQSGTFQ